MTVSPLIDQLLSGTTGAGETPAPENGLVEAQQRLRRNRANAATRIAEMCMADGSLIPSSRTERSRSKA
jgi:hypothetical protein